VLPTSRKHASVASGPDCVDKADWMYCCIAATLVPESVELLVDDAVSEETVYVEIAVLDPETTELRLTAAVES
jgi:hypothetical protein